MYYLISISDFLVFVMFIIALLRFIRKKRDVYLVWTIGFLFSFLSMLSFLIYLNSGTILFFYAYYLLGAGIPPAMWGMGAVFVLNNKKLKKISLYFTIFVSIVLFISLFFTKVSQFQSISLILYFKEGRIFSNFVSPSGSDVLKSGFWEIPVFILTFLGTIEIIVAFIYSIVIALRKKILDRILIGITIITLATAITGIVGTITRFEYFYLFWPGVVFGIALIFLGFTIL
ncbi:hypothetical protein M1145_03010 [Patescibacteria group bacterium]|nr:hypothetical protein [Patescibacteria group bacterium]